MKAQRVLKGKCAVSRSEFDSAFLKPRKHIETPIGTVGKDLRFGPLMILLKSLRSDKNCPHCEGGKGGYNFRRSFMTSLRTFYENHFLRFPDPLFPPTIGPN